jgi:death-on-curing protein
MIRLSTETILTIHSKLVAKNGGLDGVRDSHLLDSAINAPFQTFDMQDLYPTLHEKAAQLAFSLIKNHPFHDGNKRTGLAVMAAFLARNGISVNCTDDELIELGLGLADGSLDKEYLSKWLGSHVA